MKIFIYESIKQNMGPRDQKIIFEGVQAHPHLEKVDSIDDADVTTVTVACMFIERSCVIFFAVYYLG